jgi:hypothetical protein
VSPITIKNGPSSYRIDIILAAIDHTIVIERVDLHDDARGAGGQLSYALVGMIVRVENKVHLFLDQKSYQLLVDIAVIGFHAQAILVHTYHHPKDVGRTGTVNRVRDPLTKLVGTPRKNNVLQRISVWLTHNA